MTRRVRGRRMGVAGLLVAIAVIAGALGYQVLGWSSSGTSTLSVAPSPAAPPIHRHRSEHRRPVGEADGAVPAGTTVFDDAVPGVAKLDPALLGALRRAAADAQPDGVELVVNSGWRSPAYEDELRRQAVAKYGSEAEAARWVATGTTSPHVAGDAVDIGPSGAAAWLSVHGAAYGLCRIYANEPWHYELRPVARTRGCPSPYSDPTQDPRMHR